MKLNQVRRHAMSLPEVTEEPHHSLSSFRVRGRIFATFPPDEEHLHVFVTEVEREQALAFYPEFLEKLLWGGKVVGLRVTLPSARPEVVNELIGKAWAHKAPRGSSPISANAKRKATP